MKFAKLLLCAPLLVGLALLKPALDVGTIWHENAMAPFEWHIVPREGLPYDAKVHRQLDGTWQVIPVGRAPFYIKRIDDLDFMEIATRPHPDVDPDIFRSTLPALLVLGIASALQFWALRVAARRSREA